MWGIRGVMFFHLKTNMTAVEKKIIIENVNMLDLLGFNDSNLKGPKRNYKLELHGQWLEHTPRNREVRGSIPAGCWVFLFLSSVMCPLTSPSRSCSITVFPIKMKAQLCSLVRNKNNKHSIGILKKLSIPIFSHVSQLFAWNALIILVFPTPDGPFKIITVPIFEQELVAKK